MDIHRSPVRNGSAECGSTPEYRERSSAARASRTASFAVRVPPAGLVADRGGGLEVVRMNDPEGAVPMRADSGGSRFWRAQRAVTFSRHAHVPRRACGQPGTRTNPSYMASHGGRRGERSGHRHPRPTGRRCRLFTGAFPVGSEATSPRIDSQVGSHDDNDIRAPALERSTTTIFHGGGRAVQSVIPHGRGRRIRGVLARSTAVGGTAPRTMEWVGVDVRVHAGSSTARPLRPV
jgi:hypothetical protein